MTEDKLAALKDKVKSLTKDDIADHDGNMPSGKEPCPDGQKMVDGKCVPVGDGKEDGSEDEGAQAEAAEKTKLVPDPRVEALEAEMKLQGDTLKSIAEKLGGLVLNAEIKTQSETLKGLIEHNEKLAANLTAAQPPAPLPSKSNVREKLEHIDSSPESNSRSMSIEDRAARFAKQWGLEVKEPEEIEITKTPEVSPTDAKLLALSEQQVAQAKVLQGIQDQLSGLISTLSKNPSAPVAPAPAVPVIPLVGKEKRSVPGENQWETINWSNDMNQGGSIVDRAQALAQKMGYQESA